MSPCDLNERLEVVVPASQNVRVSVSVVVEAFVAWIVKWCSPDQPVPTRATHPHLFADSTRIPSFRSLHSLHLSAFAMENPRSWRMQTPLGGRSRSDSAKVSINFQFHVTGSALTHTHHRQSSKASPQFLLTHHQRERPENRDCRLSPAQSLPSAATSRQRVPGNACRLTSRQSQSWLTALRGAACRPPPNDHMPRTHTMRRSEAAPGNAPWMAHCELSSPSITCVRSSATACPTVACAS